MKTRLRLLVLAVLSSISASFSQGYYPLQVGNRWDYGELDPPPAGHFDFLYSVQIVGDTIMPNGITYSIQNYGSQADYLRQAGDTVLAYTDQGDRILYDFSAKDGDIVSVVYLIGDTITTTVHVGQSDVFNSVRKAWTYLIKPSRSSNEGWFTITDSIGRSYLFSEGGYIEYLIGAIINGVQYGIINSVNIQEKTSPGAFRLSQNYPNPFNPSTTIEYSIPFQSRVSLTVYDLLGRVVCTLDQGPREAGTFRVNFNGSNLPSGAYFCRLDASPSSKPAGSSDLSTVRRMLLVK